jgi:hypothetical protein
MKAEGAPEILRTSEERSPWLASAVLRFLMPVVLVVVALGQQVLVTTAHLSPWKGAGFGMFSTVDDPRARQLYAEVQNHGEVTRLLLDPLIDMSPRAGELITRARYLPTDRSLRAVARELSTIQWIVDEDEGEPRLRPVPGTEGSAQVLGDLATTIRIEVSARRMEAPAFTLSLDALHFIEVEL